MAKALRAEINDVVVKYTERKLRKDGTLDVAVMAHEMTQSLVDMIMDQDEHDHAPLLALMILSLAGEYLQRTGIGERRDKQLGLLEAGLTQLRTTRPNNLCGARAEARISSSFLMASLVHSLAFRRRNLRSCSSLVRAAYHSHWRARSKHSAIVGDIA
jgi:hypothetical protein